MRWPKPPDCNINQIRRYQLGTAQPILKGLVKLAKALHVSLDELVFEEQERGPVERLKLLFEAVERLSEPEQQVIQELLGSVDISTSPDEESDEMSERHEVLGGFVET
jgi:transcriptional regulator with XRE-family HTH domain